MKATADVPTGPMPSSLAQRAAAEALGTAGLLAAIVGSGFVVSASTDPALQLFAHAVVVGAALAVLIAVFGPVSGAHLNPAVTLVFLLRRDIDARLAAAMIVAQLAGAAIGVTFTNATFGRAAIEIATGPRPGVGLVVAEVAATAGLVVVILVLLTTGRDRWVAACVGAYIAAAVVFTASAAFANPAVTLARSLTDSWTGIAPGSVPGFLAGQLLGAAAAMAFVSWLFPAGGAPATGPRRDATADHRSATDG